MTAVVEAQRLAQRARSSHCESGNQIAPQSGLAKPERIRAHEALTEHSGRSPPEHHNAHDALRRPSRSAGEVAPRRAPRTPAVAPSFSASPTRARNKPRRARPPHQHHPSSTQGPSRLTSCHHHLLLNASHRKPPPPTPPWTTMRRDGAEELSDILIFKLLYALIIILYAFMV